MRKGTLVGGQIGIGLCLILTVVSEGRGFVVMLAMTGIFLGVSCCNSWAVTQTLAGPLASGCWSGVQNFIGNFAGWIAPTLTGFLVDWTGHFRLAFFLTAAMACVGAASWGLIVGPIEPVNWQRAPHEDMAPSRASRSWA